MYDNIFIFCDFMELHCVMNVTCPCFQNEHGVTNHARFNHPCAKENGKKKENCIKKCAKNTMHIYLHDPFRYIYLFLFTQRLLTFQKFLQGNDPVLIGPCFGWSTGLILI